MFPRFQNAFPDAPGASPPLGAPPATPGMAIDDGLPAPSSLPSLLSSADVAAVFGRNERTLRRWAVRGHLVRVQVRVGRSVFYRAADITRLICGELQDAIVTRKIGTSRAHL
jgi:hypothetical protein